MLKLDGGKPRPRLFEGVNTLARGCSGRAPGVFLVHRADWYDEIARGRRAYVHVVKGEVALNGVAMGEADGAKIADERRLECKTEEDTELLLFDLP